MSNFYEYLNKMNHPDTIVMDDGKTVYREHPDGSPCYAKNEKDCPVLNKSKRADLADDLDASQKLEKTATPESMELIRKGKDPQQCDVVPVTMDELPTFTDTNSKYRKLRNEAYKKILEGGQGDGTYPLDDPSHKVQHTNAEGKLQDGFADGYCVSFQTTNGEGYNEGPDSKRMSDEDYDRTAEEIMAQTGSKAYVGVFGGIPEISFRVNTMDEAMALAKKYNQVSIANNSRIAADMWDDLTFPYNDNYDWKNNQTFKAREYNEQEGK